MLSFLLSQIIPRSFNLEATTSASHESRRESWHPRRSSSEGVTISRAPVNDASWISKYDRYDVRRRDFRRKFSNPA